MQGAPGSPRDALTGRLQGRVALVTGAGRGIGAATAGLLAAEGAAVCLGEIDQGPLTAVVREIGRAGGRAVAVPGDCSEAQVADALAAAAQELGGPDIVVANAGSTRDAAFHTLEPSDWDRVTQANLGATLAVLRACVPLMQARATEELARDGQVDHQRKITTTVSAGAFTGSPGGSALSAAGGGVLALTRTLARELGGFGINVNAVVTGFIATRMTAPQTADDTTTGVPESVRQLTKAMTALGRHGTPEDVARVHLFLVSPDSDFVTGAAIPVTGGLLGTLL